ncbi:B3 domain-containing protein At1g32030-like [Quercus robur]|uniref:B3 domain-containing protein At1g32030-like n=1 Tax=Quercus robur TaxID=38942 RepID=UPI002161C7F7|nr:B3 domain-containing protein At1g32030-like [Quercus robur]
MFGSATQVHKINTRQDYDRVTTTEQEKLTLMGSSFKSITKSCETIVLSKQERLLRDKALKKPMTDSLLCKEKGFEREKLMGSTIEAIRKMDEIKRHRPMTKFDGGFHAMKEEKPMSPDFLFCQREKGLEGEKIMGAAIKAQRKMINAKRSKFYGECSSKIEEKPNNRKNKRSKSGVPIELNLPFEYKNFIKTVKGFEELLLIQKALYPTDIAKMENRLSMPLGQIRAKFLREEEKQDLDQHRMEVEVPFIEPSGTFNKAFLRQWDMKKASGSKSSMYVLKKNWNDIVMANKLKEDDVVQVWSFRLEKDDQLCLALVVVRSAEANISDDKQST